ncbi:MAG: Wzz/FepE/Etk N-terminal domain-containing protein [Balneolaceae bacterium]|nr:Wzz/FepE/Etk N-terminal domain-containing protein [Balneolaceae bacterium]
MSNESTEHHNSEDSNRSGKAKPEIRYIPVDIRDVEVDDEIDLLELVDKFWKGRRTILKTLAVFFVLGLFVALVSVEEYTSEVKLLPETQQDISLGGLGGLAQQFGFSSSDIQSGDALSVNVYPSVIQSNIFLQELMRYELQVAESDQVVTLEEYFSEYQKSSFISQVAKYTVMLPFTIKNWLSSSGGDTPTSVDRTIGNQDKLERLVRMSEKEWNILRNIRNRIEINQDTETGVVSVSVKMQDPVIAADVADEVVQMLSEYIIEKRTEKTRQDVEFIEERFEEARKRFEAAQQELAAFNDANRGQLTAMARTEEQLLQSQYNLAFNIYNSLAERLEQARIKLQEETPVINVLEPAAVPDRKSEPQRTFILAVFIVIGTIVGSGIVLLRPFFETVYFKISER